MIRRFSMTLLALATATMLSGCLGDSDLPSGPVPIEEEEFAPSLGVDLDEMTKSETGLYWQDLVVGEGEEEVGSGSKVSVGYTGWLVNGTKFDSSEAQGAPLTITVDSTNVIAGWHEGLKGMRVGGVRKIIIPSHLAYGPYSNGPIPSYATLVFDLTLVSVSSAK